MKLHIPSSKSITQRAIIISALAEGESNLIDPLISEDTEYLINALNKLQNKTSLFLDNNGTGVRFLTAYLTLTSLKRTITGSERMQIRPIQDLADALNKLGADISCTKGCPPVKINGRGKLTGGKAQLKGNLSSQYLSAILIVAPYAENDVTIEIKGKLTSKPYVNLTIDIMKKFGVKAVNHNYKKFTVKAGQKYKPRKFKIEGDASSATYFQAIAYLTGKKITITNLPKNSLQPDAKFPNLLTGKPLDIDLNDMPDTMPLAAVLAALTHGRSRITNIKNLRIKECDRIAAMQTELAKVGIRTKSGKDWLEIYGNPDTIKPATIDPHDDHRIAMAFAVMKAVKPGIKILKPECVKKSYPDFWDDYKKTLNTDKNIVLTGMRGSGKTEIGRRLAALMNREFIDIDEEIAKHEGMPITEIVKEKGWEYFRKIEALVNKKIAQKNGIVISTGGGTIINKENEKILRKNGLVIFLYCDIGTLKKRIRSYSSRPSLTGKPILEELEKVLSKRKNRYKESADLIFDTSSNESIETKANSLAFLIKQI